MYRFVCITDSNYIITDLTDNQVAIVNEEQFKRLVCTGNVCDVYFDNVLCKFTRINGELTELKRKGIYPLSYNVSSTTFIDLETLCITQRFTKESELTVPLKELLFYSTHKNLHLCPCFITPTDIPQLFGYDIDFTELKRNKYNATSTVLNACLKEVCNEILGKHFEVVSFGFREITDYVEPYILIKINTNTKRFETYSNERNNVDIKEFLYGYVLKVAKISEEYNSYIADFTDELTITIAL